MLERVWSKWVGFFAFSEILMDSVSLHLHLKYNSILLSKVVIASELAYFQQQIKWI